MTKFLIIQHEHNCGVGLLGQWWDAVGVEQHVVRGWEEPLPTSLDSYDALVVLGGSMNCKQDDEHPWLAGTKQLICDAVAHNLPMLGVCLGHQLATVALGGDVQRKDHLSVGIVPFGITEVGCVDPLFEVVGDGKIGIHYNYDAVTQLPGGAVVLATAAPDDHIQALRFAPRAWGVQFHPECTTATFGEWTVEKDEERQPALPEGRDLTRVFAEVASSEGALASAWRPLAVRFAKIAAGREAASA